MNPISGMIPIMHSCKLVPLTGKWYPSLWSSPSCFLSNDQYENIHLFWTRVFLNITDTFYFLKKSHIEVFVERIGLQHSNLLQTIEIPSWTGRIGKAGVMNYPLYVLLFEFGTSVILWSGSSRMILQIAIGAIIENAL